MPLSSAEPWVHSLYGFALALAAYAIVFGAFAANTLDGALSAVPTAQLETARAYGMNARQSFVRIQLPQMWIYALPGLANLWQILIKATPCCSCWASKTLCIGPRIGRHERLSLCLPPSRLAHLLLRRLTGLLHDHDLGQRKGI